MNRGYNSEFTVFHFPGPGCSSIAFGLGEEVGPFHVNADGKGVHMNPYSWNKGSIQQMQTQFI